jgi:hypothetical protein
LINKRFPSTGQSLQTFFKEQEFSNKMWSDRYNYYRIQFDEHLSQKLDKSFVVNYLLETKLFKQTSHQSFTNTDKFPWVDMVLVETYDGNFATSDKENHFVTLIAIVCSKRQNIDQQIYIDTFKQIANKLNWKLYLEEDDEGNENIEI